MFFLFSCAKDESLMIDENVKLGKKSVKVQRSPIKIGDGGIRKASDYRSGEDHPLMTVLGIKRNNPFDVEIMTIAWNQLYSDNRTTIPRTHSYIKFIPQSDDDLETLRLFMLESEIRLFDFPLQYEIETMGEYYHDPAVSRQELTYQYAVVPNDTSLPAVAFENLSDLYLDDSDPLLIAESFWLTSIFNDINEYPLKGGCTITKVNTYPDDVIEELSIPPMPEEPCPPGYEWKLVIDDSQMYPGNRPAYKWECQLAAPPSPSPTNNCGCPVYSSQRKPAGKVEVRNYTTNTPEGLRKAAIHLWDTWFVTDVVFTNDEGCWRLNDEYRGRMWMWVKFYNEDVTIRVRRGISPFTQGDLFWPADDYVGMFWGPDFNDICVEYLGDNSLSDTNQAYWAAATSHNAVQEYHDNPDGIPIHSDLNIVLANSGSNTGGAPMLHNGFSIMTSIVDLLVAISLGPPGLVAIIALHANLYPDITYGYRALDDYFALNQNPTFEIRNTILHECAHASHHAMSGVNWDRIRLHIVANWLIGDVYGSPGNFAWIGSDPQFVAVAEGWAHHYGDDLVGNPFLEARHFRNGFIPWGLGLDLKDPRNATNWSGYNDQVEGFTNTHYFLSLLPVTYDMQTIRDRYLDVFLPTTTNTEAQVNDLFDQYNF